MSRSPIADVPGLAYVGSRTLPEIDVQQHGYRFTVEANYDTVRAVLSWVSDVRELTFFDANHPQLSEPGAFINVVRSPDGLLAQRANHGWSSAWVPITEDEAQRYLQVCIRFHIESDSEQLMFTEPSNWRRRRSISRWRWASFRRYLNRRLRSAV